MPLYMCPTHSLTRVNRNVHCGLWMIVMCQCMFISCSRCTTLVWDVDSRGGCMFWVRVQGIYGNSLNCLFNYSVNLKLHLKNKKWCFRIVSWSLRFLSIKRNTPKNTHTLEIVDHTLCIMIYRGKMVQNSSEWLHTKKKPRLYVRRLANVCIFVYF